MSPEVQRMTAHFEALKTFLTSPAHEGFVKARQQELLDVKERILSLRPESQLNISLQLQAFGELDVLEEMVETFENAALSLKARIDETVERENQQGQTTKV